MCESIELPRQIPLRDVLILTTTSDDEDSFCDSCTNEKYGHVVATEIISSQNASPSVIDDSFWKRVFRLKPYSGELIFSRQDAARQRTMPAEVLDMGVRDIFFTVFWIACCFILYALHLGVYVIWSFTSLSEEIKLGHDIYISAAFYMNLLIWFPISLVINLYIYTNLNSLSARNRVKKLAIIYLAHVANRVLLWYCTSIFHTKIIYHFIFLLPLNVLCHFVGWLLLARFLEIEWLINVKWLVPLLFCQTLAYIIVWLPFSITNEELKHIIVYVPLMTSTIEFIHVHVLKNMLVQYQDNIRGLTVSMARLTFPLEAVRFSGFALLWVTPEYENQLKDIVWNVLFSLVGEIYSHTQIWQLCKYEMEMRLYGRRYDDFSEVYHWLSSIRSLLEYAAPVIVTTQCQLLVYWQSKYASTTEYKANFIFDQDDNVTMDKIWNALLAYYAFELLSGILCWAIRKLSSYGRISVTKNLSSSTKCLMVISVGLQVNTPEVFAEFLKLLNMP